jgi:hypothetical protein
MEFEVAFGEGTSTSTTTIEVIINEYGCGIKRETAKFTPKTTGIRMLVTMKRVARVQ